MASRCLLYYITDRTQFGGDEHARRQALLKKIAEATRAGVDYIQLRERDLSTRDLERLAVEALRATRSERPGNAEGQTATRLLINSRSDIALASEADGVHLRSGDISPADIHEVWNMYGVRSLSRENCPIVAVSCHTASDVLVAESRGADLSVFAPVFEKKNAPGVKPQGLSALREACQSRLPVLALGGVTLDSAKSCLDAGAAGIAAIRLFQENKIEEVVRTLRAL